MAPAELDDLWNTWTGAQDPADFVRDHGGPMTYGAMLDYVGAMVAQGGDWAWRRDINGVERRVDVEVMADDLWDKLRDSFQRDQKPLKRNGATLDITECRNGVVVWWSDDVIDEIRWHESREAAVREWDQLHDEYDDEHNEWREVV